MSKMGRWTGTTISVAAIAGFVLPAGPAGAEPTSGTSLAEAKAQLKTLNEKVDQLGNQYNKTMQDWKAAQSRVKALNKSVTAERTTFNALHLKVAQMAAAAYKTGDSGSIPQLMGAKDPSGVLDQMSVFTQLSRNRSTELNQFLSSAQRLEREKALADQASQQVQQRRSQLTSQKKQANAAIDKQMRLIAKLGGNIDPASSASNCSALATGKAEIVLRFACAQLGKPYVFGGAGPNSWDCSGITMVAFAKVGIHMGHYVPDQWDASRRISKSELRPGDLVFFDDNGHVGIYLGNNKFIQAPHTGDVVKISSLNDAWYSQAYNGAGRLL